MKYILFIGAMLLAGNLSAQEAGKPEPERIDAFIQGNLLGRAERLTTNSAGTLYLLPQDRMPCMAIETDLVKSMPNGFRDDGNIEKSPVPYYYLPAPPEYGQLAKKAVSYTPKKLTFQRGKTLSARKGFQLLKDQEPVPAKTPDWARPGSSFK